MATLPLSVTTPLSRSWLTETSLSPACLSPSCTLSATSGNFAGVEHAVKAANVTIPSTKRNLALHGLGIGVVVLQGSHHGVAHRHPTISSCRPSYHRRFAFGQATV